jgi:hypothetical protein
MLTISSRAATFQSSRAPAPGWLSELRAYEAARRPESDPPLAEAIERVKSWWSTYQELLTKPERLPSVAARSRKAALELKPRLTSALAALARLKVARPMVEIDLGDADLNRTLAAFVDKIQKRKLTDEQGEKPRNAWRH